VREEEGTYTHRKLIIREQRRHQIEEMLVVFVQLYRQYSKLREERLEGLRELSFLVP